MTNLTIEPTREGAIGRADILNANLVPPPGLNARHVITGGRRYTDVLVKTSEGWRFKTRALLQGVRRRAPIPARDHPP